MEIITNDELVAFDSLTRISECGCLPFHTKTCVSRTKKLLATPRQGGSKLALRKISKLALSKRAYIRNGYWVILTYRKYRQEETQPASGSL